MIQVRILLKNDIFYLYDVKAKHRQQDLNICRSTDDWLPDAQIYVLRYQNLAQIFDRMGSFGSVLQLHGGSVHGPWCVSLQPYPASNLSSVGDEDFIKGLLRGNRFSVVYQNPNTFKINTTMHCVKRRRSESWALLFHCCCCMMRCSEQHNIWSGMNHSAKTGFDETLEGGFQFSGPQ